MTRSVTIALTRYKEPDALVTQAIANACSQEGVTGEVLFIEQNPQGGVSEEQFTGQNLQFRMISRKLGGLSYARNLAMDEASCQLVLFLDADAMAAPDWAKRLADALNEDECAVAGSRILPRWPGHSPFWARANVLADQYSLLDLGPSAFPYPRVVGAAFGVDKAKLPADMRFDTNLGRRDGKLFGGEESDFCRRVRELGGGITYVGSATVEHAIPSERVRLSWILRRMVYAGQGRSVAGGSPSPSRQPSIVDWILAPAFIPPYVLGWLWGKRDSIKHLWGKVW